MADNENEYDIKTLLKSHASGTQIFIGGSVPDGAIEDLLDNLPSLPPNLHSFRDPRHDQLRKVLEEKRILILISYQESAACAAAYSLMNDDHFRGKSKRALFPTPREKERSDLDLVALTGEEFLGKEQVILFIEIASWCTLIDSVLTLSSGNVGRVRDRLEDCGSYLVLAVDEDLLGDEIRTARVRNTLPCYTVSHLRYLLSRDLADRAEDLERRLLESIGPSENANTLREFHQLVADRLEKGVSVFEEFMSELEKAHSLPLAARKERLQPIQALEVLREESEIHRTAAFTAAYFPNLSQRDFDRLVLLLLGNESTTVERTRQFVANNGEVTTLRETFEERWAERWTRDADQVFRDCHLRTVISGDGSWVVDFSESYLRRELRIHLERHFPWYLRRQCKKLQDSGAIFALDLSRVAVEGLVRLFVERTIADPAGFGTVWMLDLIRSLRIQLTGEPPSSASPDETLDWILNRIAAEAHLRAHFHGRLALLIREMLEREALRTTVRDFFEFLIAAKQHDALLNVILDLARLLRFAPHFDPYIWMRRLLDQGSQAVRERTAQKLVKLARESGPRIYEVLDLIHGWLPEEGRSPDRFSLSNQLALEFPFAYCFDAAKPIPADQFGAWPSRYPLFYALPSEQDNAVQRQEKIGGLTQWLLDPRGATLEIADASESMRTREVVRFGHVADLIELWAWILEGRSEDGPEEGRALFQAIVEEINRRIGARERTWLQRHWQRSQDDYLRQAAAGDLSDKQTRASLIARRAKLDHLRMRFASLSNHEEFTSKTEGGSRS